MASIRPVPEDWRGRVSALSALAARPWARGVDEALRMLAAHDDHVGVEVLDRLLAPAAGVRFERQTTVRKRGAPFAYDSSYDGSITRRGVVPTREGSMHDLMNAVIWRAYPRTKRAIHAHQDAALAREVAAGQTALPGRRSRLRDRLSMLDEGGVIVWARSPEVALEALLSASDTRGLEACATLGTIGARVLGHAILEHAASADPRAVRGCVVVVEVDDEARIDDAIARALERDEDAIEAWIARFPSIPLGALFESARSAPAPPR
jgi:hypothetical protein